MQNWRNVQKAETKASQTSAPTDRKMKSTGTTKLLRPSAVKRLVGIVAKDGNAKLIVRLYSYAFAHYLVEPRKHIHVHLLHGIHANSKRREQWDYKAD